MVALILVTDAMFITGRVERQGQPEDKGNKAKEKPIRPLHQSA